MMRFPREGPELKIWVSLSELLTRAWPADTDRGYFGRGVGDLGPSCVVSALWLRLGKPD